MYLFQQLFQDRNTITFKGKIDEPLPLYVRHSLLPGGFDPEVKLKRDVISRV